MSVSDTERDELVALAGLLDGSEHALPASRLPPEPRLRTELDAILARRGRVLVELDRGEALLWVTTAPSDRIADTLATAGIGLLDARERAVLALVLLRCVVRPAAAGHPPESWVEADRVPIAQIKRSKVADQHVTAALRNLSVRGLVDAAPAGVRPGPALERLTTRSRQRIERDLVALVAGGDPLVARVLDRLATNDVRDEQLAEEGP